MKITVDKENIVKEIQLIQGIAPLEGKSTIPILSNVLIESFDDKLIMTVSDLEVNIRCEVNVHIVEPGSITLSAKRLSDIIREIPLGKITFETNEDGNKINIYTPTTLFHLFGQHSEDFPQFPQLINAQSFSLSASIFKEMIKKTIFAVSKDEFRPTFLQGIFLSLSKKNIEMAATDGHRLSVIIQDIDINFETPIKLIVPVKAMERLSRILEEKESVKVDITEREVSFTAGNIILISKLIKGEFLNYKGFIPTEYKTKVKVNRDNLLDACRRVSLLNSTIIKFSISKDNFVINSIASEIGDAMEELEFNMEGENMEIGFKPGYVIDGLKNIKGDEVDIALVSSETSGVIVSFQDEGYTYLIMPMRM